ncbi:MAG: alpha/beta hydrolase [Bacteroidia bacterium]|nr:alpha/beta hydrolase [Bacteroidia bacterium]MDW8300865.1 alpha/beta hydrolase [Bacteroidia bacterium]
MLRLFFSTQLRNFLLLGALALVLVYACVSPKIMLSPSEMQIYQQLSSVCKEFPTQIHYLYTQERKVRYLVVGHDSLPTLMMLHGSPGSMMSYWDYLLDKSLLKQFRLVVPDKLGYGGSELGKTEISLEKQAYYMHLVLKKEVKNKQPIFLMGTSYGGSVAARLAMDYPESIQGLMLVSASLFPNMETTYLISYRPFWQMVRWLLPKALWVANDEKLSHHEQLAKMQNLWYKIHVPCLIIHSYQDNLISVNNALTAYKQLKNAPVKLILLEDGNHYIIWNYQNLIVNNLLQLKAVVLGKLKENIWVKVVRLGQKE